MLLFFMLFIISIGLIFVFSEIRLNIINYQYSSNKHIKSCDKSNKVTLQFYFLGKIKFLSFNIIDDKKKKRNITDIIKQRILKVREKTKLLNKIDRREKSRLQRNILKFLIKKSKINKLNLKVMLDTNNVEITSFLIGAVSTLIPNLLKKHIKKYNSSNYKYTILPLYQNINFVYFELNCIISIKVLHIIDIFKGGYIHERTSNRKFNVNCYGKH